MSGGPVAERLRHMRLTQITGRELSPAEVEALIARVLGNRDIYVYIWRRDGSPVPETVAH